MNSIDSQKKKPDFLIGLFDRQFHFLSKYNSEYSLLLMRLHCEGELCLGSKGQTTRWWTLRKTCTYASFVLIGNDKTPIWEYKHTERRWYKSFPTERRWNFFRNSRRCFQSYKSRPMNEKYEFRSCPCCYGCCCQRKLIFTFKLIVLLIFDFHCQIMKSTIIVWACIPC